MEVVVAVEIVEYEQGQDGSSRSRGGRAWAWVALTVVAAVAAPVIGAGQLEQETSAASTCPGATYTVVGGDSWFKIATQHGVTMAALTAANNATTSTMIHPGNVLCLPTGVTTAPTTTTAPVGAVSIRQFPVQGTCSFTDTYGAPRSGGRSHEGVDIIAPSGKLVYAADDGALTKQYIDAPGSLSGNGWRLTRPNGTYFFYAHLSAFAPGLKVGSVVKSGQIIGYVGATGNAGTPHLHFEVHPGGGASVNPTPIVRAVNGCSTTVVPPQPGDVATTAPTTAAPTTVAPTTAPATTMPATTAPPATVPATPTTPSPTAPAVAGPWAFIAPVNALDTGGNKLVPGNVRRVTVGGRTGVPAGTDGVMLRLATRNAASRGFLSVFACDGAPPPTSTLNYNPSLLSATMTVVKVVGGDVCVQASSSVDLRVDVVAVRAASGVGMQPIVAKRAFDTRLSSPIAAGGTRSASLAAMGAPTGAKAVSVTVTLLAPAGAGSIGIGPCGGTPWILPFAAGQPQVFSGVIRTNDSGVCVSATASVHVVLDISGVWTGAAALAPVASQRLFDSRTQGIVAPSGKIAAIAVPAGATRAQITVTLVAGTSGAALIAWNCFEAKPVAAIAYTPALTTNSATVTMSVAGGALCMASTADVHVVVDLHAAG